MALELMCRVNYGSFRNLSCCFKCHMMTFVVAARGTLNMIFGVPSSVIKLFLKNSTYVLSPNVCVGIMEVCSYVVISFCCFVAPRSIENIYRTI